MKADCCSSQRADGADDMYFGIGYIYDAAISSETDVKDWLTRSIEMAIENYFGRVPQGYESAIVFEHGDGVTYAKASVNEIKKML